MKLTSQLEKMRLLTTEPQFKKNSTKQEYAPTNVGMNSLVLFERPHGPQSGSYEVALSRLNRPRVAPLGPRSNLVWVEAFHRMNPRVSLRYA